MTDDLETRLASLEATLAEGNPWERALSVFDERIAASRQAPPPPPAPAPAAPAAAGPTDVLSAAMAKMDAYDPFTDADPEPTMMGIFSTRQGMLMHDIKDALASGANLEQRLELRQAWDRAKAEGRDQREQVIRSVVDRAQAQREAAAAAQVELRDYYAHQREAELRQLGRLASQNSGGMIWEQAQELGALDHGEDALRQAGFGYAAIENVKALRERTVTVDPGKISGQGFLVHQREDGSHVAYVPVDQSVGAFADRFGVA